jgi:signal transduction histidine kinase
LRSYLDGFHQNYGIQVDISIGKGVDNAVFAPEAQMELFRILQEAFSNVRKHAGTSCVHLSFDRKEDLVRICVQDDGQGFDPRLVEHQSGDHFGLGFMRERAEALCGDLRVHSAPGEGTSLLVEIPVNTAPFTAHSLSFHGSQDESLDRR